MKQKHPEDAKSVNKNDSNNNKMHEKVDQMKTILQDLTSGFPIPETIILPPIEINPGNMETYVGKPKYLKDR